MGAEKALFVNPPCKESRGKKKKSPLLRGESRRKIIRALPLRGESHGKALCALPCALGRKLNLFRKDCRRCSALSEQIVRVLVVWAGSVFAFFGFLGVLFCLTSITYTYIYLGVFMSARLIGYDASFDQTREEILFTLALLKANPLTAAHAKGFEEAKARWTTTRDSYLELKARQVTARAMQNYWDGVLDGLIDSIESTVNLITGKDKTSSLYQFFFGKKSPSVLKKPLLGGQLETMESWIAPMEGPNMSEKLKALLPALKEAVAGGKASTEERDNTAAALKEFQTFGEWKKLIDDVNLLRKETFGALDKLPLAQKEKNLPKDFARRFFLQSRSGYTSLDLEEELALVTEELNEKRQEVAILEARQGELLAKKEAQDREQTERQKKQEQLEALRRQLAALESELT